MLLRRLALLTAGILLTAPLAAVPSAAAPDPAVVAHAEKQKPKKKKDPRKSQGLFVDPRMPAAQEGPSYAAIAKRAQALWFTDYYPTASVASAARDYLGRAKAAKKTPMMVVYAIPGRDCGQHSSGGLADGAAYKKWITQLAKGIKGSKPLLVLEPDAIGFYADNTSCPGTAPWPGLLSYAAKRLTKAGAWVYLDSAHSNWTNANGGIPGRAALLKRSGIGYARGFSTNVSNFRTTAAEKAYAASLLRELKKLGVKGKKYVVDTSRNGAAGGPQDDRVINPTWARLGAPPKLQFKGAFDGTLWVKHPGESDGPECGGPSSGQWSDLLADRLLGRDVGATC